MITVKQTGVPESGNSWSYGPDYMRKISDASARALCGMYPLPKIGHETIVAIKPGGWGFKLRLTVQNIGGAFFIASTGAKVCDWPSVFGVTVK